MVKRATLILSHTFFCAPLTSLANTAPLACSQPTQLVRETHARLDSTRSSTTAGGSTGLTHYENGQVRQAFMFHTCGLAMATTTCQLFSMSVRYSASQRVLQQGVARTASLTAFALI